MAPFLGFVLVTHQQPEQIAFVCHKLSSMFDNPPIAIHHDYSKSPLALTTLPPQVKLVENWIPTSWGTLSIVKAFLAALKLLHATSAPEWTISLSAADYPIQTAETILQNLCNTKADAFLDYREITKKSSHSPDPQVQPNNYNRPAWLISARERYVSLSVVPYAIRKHIGYKDRCIYVDGSLTTRFFTPFHHGYLPYGGDTWLTANRRAALALLAEDETSRRLMRHYERRAIPDESYYHTLLLNRTDLAIENDNRRYTIWKEGAAHPSQIDFGDIPDMVASNAQFARKFPFNPELYAAVDAGVARHNLGLSVARLQATRETQS